MLILVTKCFKVIKSLHLANYLFLTTEIICVTKKNYR